MKQQIEEIVLAHWEARFPELVTMVDERARQIENLLTLEEFYRSGREDSHLGKALGGFGTAALDMGSLSSVLRRGEDSRTMEAERYHRIQNLFKELIKLRKNLEKDRPACQFVELELGVDAVLDAFESHIARQAKTFRTLRIAQFEAAARYDPREHTAFFEDFNWRHLDNEEMALCPPMVVFGEGDRDARGSLHDILELVTGGRPLKVALIHRQLASLSSETGRAAALRSTGGQELLFISLRNVYFLQSSIAGSTPLETLLGQGLDSPRPAIFSIFADPGEAGHFNQNGSGRSAQALRSRAFPHFEYDPERATDFVSCLELSDNPSPEALWPLHQVEFLNAEGQPEQLEFPFTFADFLAGEPALANHFTAPSAEEEHGRLMPLTEFLAMTPTQRRDKVPFIYTVDAEQHLQRRVPSQSIVAQTADRMHLWHSLQELGGIRNPYVQAAEQKAVERLTAEKEQSLAELKAQLESRSAEREQQAVHTAMKTLALKLTGMVPLDAPPSSPGVPAPGLRVVSGASPVGSPALTEAPPAPAAEGSAMGAEGSAMGAEGAAMGAEGAAAVSETPWIETSLCTTCDECTTINKKIFAYNADKKAFIKDPRGGPFRDIVKAAEKCSSGAIHPGMPLDPNEKDLEKWIKRAEPYQ